MDVLWPDSNSRRSHKHAALTILIPGVYGAAPSAFTYGDLEGGAGDDLLIGDGGSETGPIGHDTLIW